ncbi:MAG: nicotinate phosphoribosyltransferase [Ardenticatenaceae bacterium]|nr:MAG: nicotinate phosphoribosyltransferase [Ardenticatenaceae bacterium]
MKSKDKSLAEGILFTDMYQLTMANLYFRMGLHEKTVQFDHFFRSYPDYGAHKAGYCISAGLEWLIDWMQEARFGEKEIAFLRQQTGQTGKRLFEDDFLDWLHQHGHFGELTLRAIPEGRVVHPNVPLTTVQGPLAMAQILETPLLNMLNYPTLIATRAARISHAGRGQLMLEFGMRRGQERGVNAGARAALIGGADFSSNAGISGVLGFEPKGTHAHSMVQLYMALGEGELAAFRAYADVYPDDCLLLVDTINTLESGLPNAITVFDELRQKGHEPLGIRLDSGDLAYLAVQSAKLLNQAGYPDVSIVLSNQLDELAILQILAQIRDEASRNGIDGQQVMKRLVYGVGTSLITSAGDGALDGVYKLVAVQEKNEWVPAIKMSENPVKTPNPGHKNVWRVYDKRGLATADLLTLDDENPTDMDPLFLQHPVDSRISRTLAGTAVSHIEPLLTTVWDKGKVAYEQPSLAQIRQQRRADIERLDSGVRRLINPHIYHVSLSQKLWELKQTLINNFKKK